MSLIIAVLLLCLVDGALLSWVVSEIRKAPFGFEDTQGFHYGFPPAGHEVFC